MGNNHKTIYFLGAGSSVEAGVPDMYGFVEKFSNHLTTRDPNNSLKDCLDQVCHSLKSWLEKTEAKDKRVDLELLMDALSQLLDPDRQILFAFSEKSEDIPGEDKIRDLYDELIKFIKGKCVAEPQKLLYLEPLLNLRSSFKPLEIFSVNYDLCVETLCTHQNVNFYDGFKLEWEPEGFNSELDVKLFKLHGSAMWYETDRHSYIKLPIDYNQVELPHEFPLLTGEAASSLMLYPLRGKQKQARPLAFCAYKLSESLVEADLCIVIGYSFRDPDLNKMFAEALRANSRLNIALMSPSAVSTCLTNLSDNIFNGRIILIEEKTGQGLSDNFLLNFIQKYQGVCTLEASVGEKLRRGHPLGDELQKVANLYAEIGHGAKLWGWLNEWWNFELTSDPQRYNEWDFTKIEGYQEYHPISFFPVEKELLRHGLVEMCGGRKAEAKKVLEAVLKIFKVRDELLNKKLLVSNLWKSHPSLTPDMQVALDELKKRIGNVPLGNPTTDSTIGEMIEVFMQKLPVSRELAEILKRPWCNDYTRDVVREFNKLLIYSPDQGTHHIGLSNVMEELIALC